MKESEHPNQVALVKVSNEEDIRQVEELADQIWTQHYTPIIGIDQVRYMLKNFQSSAAIAKQISEGMQYYLLYFENEAVGYLAFKQDDEDLFLSKIYVLSRMRGKGIGSYAMRFLSSVGEEMGLRNLSLTVNKNNSDSISAYEKLGFVNLGAVETDIGKGFIMDDYLMKKKL